MIVQNYLGSKSFISGNAVYKNFAKFWHNLDTICICLSLNKAQRMLRWNWKMAVALNTWILEQTLIVTGSDSGEMVATVIITKKWALAGVGSQNWLMVAI